MTHVVVNNMAGEMLELTMSPESTICDAKSAIEKEWQIPMIFQDLLLGAVKLPNHKCIGTCASQSVGADFLRLPLQLVVSAEQVHDELKNHSIERKLAALKKLSAVAMIFGARVVDIVIGAVDVCFDDPSVFVKQTAIEVLAQIAQNTDSDVVSRAVDRLIHSDEHVRCSALDTLSHVAKVGDADVIESVRGCLSDSEPTVRMGALGALSRLANANDTDITATLTSYLAESKFERRAAIDALAQMARRGNRNAVIELHDCLDDEDEYVHLVAEQALEQIKQSHHCDSSCVIG